MKFHRNCVIFITIYTSVSALTCPSTKSRHTKALFTATTLAMKPDTPTKLQHIGQTPNTLLRYRDVHQFEEDNTIALKWFEEFPMTILNWKKDVTLNEPRSNSKVEGDNEMSGCAIKHIDNHASMDGVELLPDDAPMIDFTPSPNMIHNKVHKSSHFTFYAIKKLVIECSRHLRPHSNRVTQKSLNWNFNLLDNNKYHDRISKDLCHISLSIAQTIDTPQQWSEFVQNGGGLDSIVQCIHNVVEDIKKGCAPDIDGIEFYAYHQQKENSFQAACNACKILRDLCSKDANWAAVITDELLHLNQGVGRDSGLLNDLVALLKHTNEGGFLYTRKIWKKRRELRAEGIRIKGGYTSQQRKDTRQKCRLYILQLLLGLTLASDEAIEALQGTPDLISTVKSYSSYAVNEKLKRRWINHPYEVFRRLFDRRLDERKKHSQAEYGLTSAPRMQQSITGQLQATSNKLLAALGHNVFIPKSPDQKGLRILCLDGGGTRGIASLEMVKCIVDTMGGVEVCDAFDLICGTSTGAIIAFLIGLRRESQAKASKRYDELIDKIFVKDALSAPMLLLTTASYSEVPFTKVMDQILGDTTMLDSRADARTPLVFAVSSKMSSSTSKMALFRNYNYEGGSNDNFVIPPDKARKVLGLPPLQRERMNKEICSSRYAKSNYSSRHEGSFRIMQKAAMRATTAAPTFFRPVLMGGDMYSDGGLIASNPTAVAIHEARQIYPNTPIEMIVSIGTGEFVNEKISPKFGWDGVITQIVKSATDTSRTHWIVEDILGNGNTVQGADTVSQTKYYRFDPVVGTSLDFPIDETNKNQLEKLKRITKTYMQEYEQKEKLVKIGKTLGVHR